MPPLTLGVALTLPPLVPLRTQVLGMSRGDLRELIAAELAASPTSLEVDPDAEADVAAEGESVAADDVDAVVWLEDGRWQVRVIKIDPAVRVRLDADTDATETNRGRALVNFLEDRAGLLQAILIEIIQPGGLPVKDAAAARASLDDVGAALDCSPVEIARIVSRKKVRIAGEVVVLSDLLLRSDPG
ncbi:MAG: hypothetical protein M4D80_42150 [Myxococcota bacterium]|nr:hypothetical protein [Myxococcota bacterium]